MYPSLRRKQPTNARKRTDFSLSRFKQFSNTNLDYVEKEAKKGDSISDTLLAIEDASEIAKSYMFRPGVFEKILRIATRKPTHCITFEKTGQLKCIPQIEIAHIGLEIPNVGGHYSSAVKKGKNVYMFDSMCKSMYSPTFKRAYQKIFKTPKITQEHINVAYQPSGGFAPETPAIMKNIMKEANVPALLTNNNAFVKSAHRVAQYDLLSQHHFCYIESLVYLFSKIYGTPIGPKSPERRIRFIKSIMWAFILKFVRPKRNAAFAYFFRNFPYYLKQKSGVKYSNKGFYLPTGEPITYALKRIRVLKTYQAQKMSIPQIIKYSLKA